MADNAANSPSKRTKRNQNYASQNVDDELYARLKAESIAPYKGLRKFIYIAFAASGTIGGVIFLTQVLAGRDVDAALPNLALQIGVVALMVWLFRLEGRTGRKQ